MIIDLSKISADGSPYVGEDPVEGFDLDQEEDIRPESGVHYDLFALIVSDELIVKGSLTACLSMKCARCAGFFSTTVSDSAFLRVYSLLDQPESLDLSEDIREAVLLNIPHFSLCGEDCKGLCPECGTNLNVGSCSCNPQEEESVWGALDNLDTNE